MAKKKKAKSKATKKKATGRKSGGRSWRDTIKEDYAKKQERSRGDYWNFPDGQSTIRLLPFTHEGDEHVFVETFTHRIEEGDATRMLSCPQAECPICELAESLEEDAARGLRPRRRYLANVIVRGHPDELKIARIPVTVHDRMLDYLEGDESEFCPGGLDPKKGHDFRISRTGKGLRTEYACIVVKRPCPVGLEVKPVDLFDRIGYAKEEALREAADKLSKLYE